MSNWLPACWILKNILQLYLFFVWFDCKSLIYVNCNLRLQTGLCFIFDYGKRDAYALLLFFFMLLGAFLIRYHSR